ncbi:sugar phosphate isomerase/epimerase [Paenibacillus polysaccharolyticus]|uniref:sugar phosphate isomerase/epimerase family protein n=1 Tax=Paenibacillus polysaccharolyticus TaxID=582692 RepID=UPI00203E7706|nr:sugar phosphate isomerase/epimerase family protein [Paenibacillus polysaccharolyticus]MCM3132111.1 sugar phosphate isomerase/epimerase [Paenibacillus polysaccharolyticus]
MKLSIFTVAVPDLDANELASAASAAGIDGIEWRFRGIPEDALSEQPSFWRNNRCSIDPDRWQEQVPVFREAAKDHDRTSIALVPYLNCGDMTATEQAFQAASTLGASMMRVGVPGYDRSTAYPELYGKAVRYLNEVQDIAKQYKIKAIVETHHQTIAPTASLAYRLVQSLDSEHVGVLYDPGNMVHEGYENHRMGLELLGPYLAHVHVKNAGWYKKYVGNASDQGALTPRSDSKPLLSTPWQCRWAPLTEGMVDWVQMVRDLRAVGYDGYYGIEDFSGTLDSRAMLQHFADVFAEIERRVYEEEQA